MPQITIRNVDLATVEKLSAQISETVRNIVNVPSEHIVVEHNSVSFFRKGLKDETTAMVWVCWKKRPKELRQKVAEAMAEIFFAEGFTTVETIYDNLDMNDFFEYKK